MRLTDSESFGHALVDEAIVRTMVPWPCPSEFGPDGRFRLEELIGVGRVSLVYRAVDTHLSSEGFQAEVAIKIVDSAHAQRQEALNARRVRHPNVVQIIDRGVTDGDVSYIVEELVTGATMADRPAPWPVAEGVAFLVKVARGVQAVHSAGIVHCDLKPANVLVSEQGEPKVADFGLALSGEAGEVSGGNLAFMAPEQHLDPVAGTAPPADVYALGGLLGYVLTGRPPNGEDREEAIERLRAGTEPEPMGVDRDLDLICRKALSPDPMARHHSAGAFADDLECWLRSEPIRWTQPGLARRSRLWLKRNRIAAGLGAVVIVSALVLVGSWAYVSFERQRQQILSQQRAVELADEQVEEISSRVRGHLRMMFMATLNTSTSDFVASVLPSLVWLDWITDHEVLAEIRKEEFGPARITFLQAIADEARASGRADHVDAILAEYSLAYFLILDGRGQEAASVIRRVRPRAGEVLQPDDPYLASLEAMETAADVLVEAAAGADAESLRARLAKADQSLVESGRCETTRQLLYDVRNSLAD